MESSPKLAPDILYETSIEFARQLSEEFTEQQHAAARRLLDIARTSGGGSEGLESTMKTLEVEIGQDVLGYENEVLAHRLIQLSLTGDN